ncbi:uncharacterized protein LOC134182093 [Corticium candelabrum]|uniref:uncharacterized protein LOC134182093 n=1 Tax=Corticium candelabrum TaxID=121492 RepID=UPI002E26040A|nr:uncharacterized protein LOC134182093 [Corticium candelabrum]
MGLGEQAYGAVSSNPPRVLFIVSWYALGIAFLYIRFSVMHGEDLKDDGAARAWNKHLGILSDPQNTICLYKPQTGEPTQHQISEIIKSKNTKQMCTEWKVTFQVQSDKLKDLKDKTYSTRLNMFHICQRNSSVCDPIVGDATNIFVIIRYNDCQGRKKCSVCLVVQSENITKTFNEQSASPVPCKLNFTNTKAELLRGESTNKGESCASTSANKKAPFLLLTPSILHKLDPLPTVNATPAFRQRSERRSLYASILSFSVAVLLSLFAVLLHKPDSQVSKVEEGADEQLIDNN